MHDRKIDHRSHQRTLCQMKLSIEAKVAATVAVAFAALSIGAIAQEQSENGTDGPAKYAVTSSQMSLQESESSLSEYGGTGENQLLARY
jgi:hypothetical protein